MASREQLLGVCDAYLASLAARAVGAAPLAREVFNTENNVQLDPGDGCWNTITELHNYRLVLAEPEANQVAVFTAIEETDALNPCCIRMEVDADGLISGVETVVARNEDEGFPFGPQFFKDKPAMLAPVPPEERMSREELVRIADGYFETIERNDGTINTVFAPDCNRVENGVQTTNNRDFPLQIARLGCEEQFALGWYRYDDDLRARRFPLVDVEQGIVLAYGFIDHSGALGSYTLTNGEVVTSPIRRPHSYYLAEAFKITGGAIRQVEADFLTVPYRMPSPWDAR
ncbi:hypothetical protein [Alteraurantiacibacter aquimixticola]|uniref:DUF8021 domain-containing protein n=1 Tax=Alteraurantiacibacter aquimixticola TaxID=2489173 RepID=A0A4T3F4F1_9SPHN|nr:hypothetical protein [Alteraurantiacibacter aquimixticola]TIX49583.1 hypothetical protein E5222_12150 [Alteraurantiacibacter aquimixticola]